MRSKSILTLLLVGSSLACAREDSSSGARSPSSAGPAVELSIRPAKSSFRVGEQAAFEVRLVNRSSEPVILPGALDGSDRAGRLPHLVWSVTGPPDGWSLGMLGYCGNMNPLRPEDLVEVPSGGELDPYARIDSGGFFGSSFLSTGSFALPGRYEFALRYSTEESGEGHRRWQGSDPRLERVPRLTLVARATVEVLP